MINCIAISGAHRVGKSTLAKRISKETGIRYLDASVASCDVWSRHCITPSTQLSPELRVEVQREISDFLFNKFHSQSEPFITDRSFVDVAAYLWLGAWKSIDNDLLETHVSALIEFQNMFFGQTFLLQPGITIIAEPGKEDKTYLKKSTQETLNSLMLEIGEHIQNFKTIPRKILPISERIEFVCNQLSLYK